eukprot:9588916-Alexandrium_andersonii.AAC.1
MGVLHVRPSNPRVLPDAGLLAVRTLGLSRPRSALTTQLAPAEPIQKWPACRAPILPVQIEELHVAVDQVGITALVRMSA